MSVAAAFFVQPVARIILGTRNGADVDGLEFVAGDDRDGALRDGEIEIEIRLPRRARE